VRLSAGWYTAWIGNRKAICVGGYFLAGVWKAIHAFAYGWPLMLRRSNPRPIRARGPRPPADAPQPEAMIYGLARTYGHRSVVCASFDLDC